MPLSRASRGGNVGVFRRTRTCCSRGARIDQEQRRGIRSEEGRSVRGALPITFGRLPTNSGADLVYPFGVCRSILALKVRSCAVFAR